MRGALARSLLLLGFFVAAAGTAALLKPDTQVASVGSGAGALATFLPDRFAGWRTVPNRQMVLPDPGARRLVDEIYDETIVRTFENARGDQVMLVLAYGTDQSDQLQLHRPEVCYRAQGFAVKELGLTRLPLGAHGSVPVRLLVTEKPLRREPVTYWMRVGDRAVEGILDRQWAKLATGLKGRIPDGVLVRISSISSDPVTAFGIQQQFIRDLVEAVGPRGRRFLLGRDAALDVANSG